MVSNYDSSSYFTVELVIDNKITEYNMIQITMCREVRFMCHTEQREEEVFAWILKQISTFQQKSVLDANIFFLASTFSLHRSLHVQEEIYATTEKL